MNVLYVIVILWITSSGAVPAENTEVRKASLERAIEMMQESDDWMNTLKFMMKNSSKGFKFESRRVLEYEGEKANLEVNPDITPAITNGRTLLTMVDIPTINADLGRPIGMRPQESMTQGLVKIPNSNIVVGNVGVCKTQFEIQRFLSAPLLSNPTGPHATLANPLYAMVGSCVRSQPTINTGSTGGRCVLTGHPHKTRILVPVESRKNSPNCAEIPGVTSLLQCSDWVVIGGRCVYDLSRV